MKEKEEAVARREHVSNIETYQPLQAGSYWRALVNIKEEGIQRADVLLLESIRDVDNEAHTIILRPHPSRYGKEWWIEKKKGVRSYQGTLTEHRFLVQDFLKKFQFEPDAKLIRETEIAAVQQKIGTLQDELVNAQSNRETLKAIAAQYSDRVADDEKESDAIALSSSELSIASAIRDGITPEKIEVFRGLINHEALIAKEQSDWISGKVKEISDTIKDLTPFYAEKAAAALARTEDIQTYAKGLLKGIHSLELYVGTGVEVQQIRAGEDAPEIEPLTITQRKLYMDEELSVWADVDESFDFQDQDKFLEALRTSDELVNQIFPAPRAVVAMATRRRDRSYGDPWIDAAKNAQNKLVFLLIRNGWNIYRVYSPVESHLGANRLFPVTTESDEHFKERGIFGGLDGSTITFQDVQYTDRLEKFEEMALHYKRFLILLCGLDHRKRLFGKFYPGKPSFEFVSQEFQQRYFRFVHDEDGKGMLPTEDRTPFLEWISEKNKGVRSGSRVLCHWETLMTPKTAPGAFRSSHYVPNSYNNENYRSARAVADIEPKVVFTYDGVLQVEAACKNDSWRSERLFNCKVRLSRTGKYAEERYGVTFLCLDDIEPTDLRWYIHDRESREHHLKYIQFFKRALKIIEQERKSEAHIRARMKTALEEGGIASGDDADAIVQRTVVAWRASHRGEPLPIFTDQGAPAEWKSLLDQMYLLAGDAASRVQDIQAFIGSLGFNEPLRLIASSSSKLAVYVAPRPEEQDDRLVPHAWVHRITLEAKKKGDYREMNRCWVSLPTHAASETVIHEWPSTAAWIRGAKPFQRFEEKQTMFAALADFAEKLKPFTGPMDETTFDRYFTEWKMVRSELNRRSRGMVVNPALYIPFGLKYYSVSDDYYEEPNLKLICVGTDNPHFLLYNLAPPKRKQEVREKFASIYRFKTERLADFDTAVTKNRGGKVHVTTNSIPASKELGLFSIGWGRPVGEGTLDHQLAQFVKEQKEKKGSLLWIPDEIRSGKFFKRLFGGENVIKAESGE